MGYHFDEDDIGNSRSCFSACHECCGRSRNSLCEFVTEAVKDKLAAETRTSAKPWLRHMGKLKNLRKETTRINRLIEADSEKIDSEMWR